MRTTALSLAVSASVAALSGCGDKKEAAPPPAPDLGALANQLSGKTNQPPPPTNAGPKRSTEEILQMVAAPKEATNTMAGRTFIDGLKDKAARNDADAMYWLGYYYHTGKDVPQNLEEGVKWYQEAAERNHPEAQFALGKAFEEGRGAPKDPVLAYQWYYLAAQKGQLDAIERRDKLAEKMPDYEVDKGRRMAEQFVPK